MDIDGDGGRREFELRGRQLGTEQGGSSRSWLRGFRDLFQGTGRSGKNGVNDRSRNSYRILIKQARHDLGAIVHICRSAESARLCASEHFATIRTQSRPAASGDVLHVVLLHGSNAERTGWPSSDSTARTQITVGELMGLLPALLRARSASRSAPLAVEMSGSTSGLKFADIHREIFDD
jgi:hypothetical protein